MSEDSMDSPFTACAWTVRRTPEPRLLRCSNSRAAELRQALGVERTLPVGRLEGRNAAKAVIAFRDKLEPLGGCEAESQCSGLQALAREL